MHTRAHLLGHPIHQMLIPIPFGLLVSGAVIDIISYAAGTHALALVSYWNIVLGIVTALVAAVFGLIDWTGIPKGTRAKRVGALHGIGNVVMVLLFAIIIGVRMDEPRHIVGGGTVMLEIVALMLGAVTGWLGGELVDKLGIGVHEDAHPDAPSSVGAEKKPPIWTPAKPA